MDLIFFDLDGTLLNDESEISTFTKETLALLRDKDIAYTVATGRTMLSAQRIVEGHDFDLPQIYNNGVTVWDPKVQQLTLENLLSENEVRTVIDSALARGITPFVNTIGHQKTDNQFEQYKNHHLIFHTQPRHEVEKNLIDKYFSRTDAVLLPIEGLSASSQVTNISMIGDAKPITQMWRELNEHDNLIAYSGTALEGKQYMWMDVHHCQANKGSAVSNLKEKLGAENVICFGDGDNDLSMFELADESYAPENADANIKELASSVIGHNHKDGIAHFLRERFSL
jgi:Cof subfamily protein (haloacid dehalogenase superfamily)